MSFPSSPVDGQTYNGYQYDSTLSVWQKASQSSGSGFKNIITNGDFKINQRGASSKTDTSKDQINSLYTYDRWIYSSGTLQQRIEDGNYRPDTSYTLSGINVTTQQLTSPSSGTWTIDTGTTNPNDVQLEEGTIVSLFEKRPVGLELSLCKRYYTIGKFTGYHWASASSLHGAASTERIQSFPVTMRIKPTMSYTFVDGDQCDDKGLSSVNENYVRCLSQSRYAGQYCNGTWTWKADAELI